MISVSKDHSKDMHVVLSIAFLGSTLTETVMSAIETPMFARRMARMIPGSSRSSISCCAVLIAETLSEAVASGTAGAGAEVSSGVNQEGASWVAMVVIEPQTSAVSLYMYYSTTTVPTCPMTARGTAVGGRHTRNAVAARFNRFLHISICGLRMFIHGSTWYLYDGAQVLGECVVQHKI